MMSNANPSRNPRASAAVAAFEAVYRPVLAAGPVVFTDYDLVASNR